MSNIPVFIWNILYFCFGYFFYFVKQRNFRMSVELDAPVDAV